MDGDCVSDGLLSRIRGMLDDQSYQEEDVRELVAIIDAQRLALAGLVNCIDTSAADNGPPITRDSMMAQVCKVLQRTTQYDAAKAALAQETRGD
jgi:hypothetical protein